MPNFSLTKARPGEQFYRPKLSGARRLANYYAKAYGLGAVVIPPRGPGFYYVVILTRGGSRTRFPLAVYTAGYAVNRG